MLTRNRLMTLVATVAAIAIPASVYAYTPPPVYQLTLKKPDLTITGVKASLKPPCAGALPTLRFLVTVANVGKLDMKPGPVNQALGVTGPSHKQYADLPFIAGRRQGRRRNGLCAPGRRDAVVPGRRVHVQCELEPPDRRVQLRQQHVHVEAGDRAAVLRVSTRACVFGSAFSSSSRRTR